jgi:hypothetical protein
MSKENFMFQEDSETPALKLLRGMLTGFTEKSSKDE